MGVQTLPVHCLKSFTSNSIYPPSSPALRISTSGQEWFACCRKHGFAAISSIEHPFFFFKRKPWGRGLLRFLVDCLTCSTGKNWSNLLSDTPMKQVSGTFLGCSRNVPTNTPVTFKEEYTPGVRDFSVVKIFNRPFYPYGGHIEFIRFKEYYGMPRWQLFCIYARFSGKMRTSLYTSREKGVHYYMQTRYNGLFFPLQSFSMKT